VGLVALVCSPGRDERQRCPPWAHGPDAQVSRGHPGRTRLWIGPMWSRGCVPRWERTSGPGRRRPGAS